MTQNFKKNSKLNGVFVICIVIFGILLSISSASLLSGLVTVGSFSALQTANSLSFDVFILAPEGEDKSSNLEKYTQMQQDTNGANAIIASGDKYYSVHSIYLEETDAEKVKTSLEQNEDVHLSVFKLHLSKVNSSDSQILDMLSKFKENLQALIDISVCYDTSNINKEEAKVKVKELHQNLQSKLQTVEITEGNSKVTLVKLKLEKLSMLLQKAENDLGKEIGVSSYLKALAVECFKIRQQLTF